MGLFNGMMSTTWKTLLLILNWNNVCETTFKSQLSAWQGRGKSYNHWATHLCLFHGRQTEQEQPRVTVKTATKRSWQGAGSLVASMVLDSNPLALGLWETSAGRGSDFYQPLGKYFNILITSVVIGLCTSYLLVMRTTAQQEKVLISVLVTLLNSEIPVINLKNILGEFGGYAIHFGQALKITMNIFSIDSSEFDHFYEFKWLSVSQQTFLPPEPKPLSFPCPYQRLAEWVDTWGKKKKGCLMIV